MKLQTILDALTVTAVSGSPAARRDAANRTVTELCYDSRRATPGALFVAIVGTVTDGHRYTAAAYRAGCRAFLVEHPTELPEDAVQYTVPNTRHALADGAATLYGHPEREIRLIGLTGTKGKTTTCLLIRHLLESAGIPTGYIGTNGIDFADFHFATVNSTPESVEIYRHLRLMVNEGIQACVLEVSSQALWMDRVRGLSFDTAIYTNLSRDHIGGVEHPDFDHYRASKRRLFTDYPVTLTLANREDASMPYVTAQDSSDHPLVTYATVDLPTADIPDYAACAIRPTQDSGRIGTEFTVALHGQALPEPWFIPLPGTFNVQNALAALAVACERFGIHPLTARDALATVSVPGRFEPITHPALPDVTFVIDYAHNGVSLASILDALADYRPRRLIALFGSVGGRTRERRRDLAEAAADRCDLCILTSDNPASEPPMDILREIDEAFPSNACPRLLIPDRAEAIRTAVRDARPGDIILLAGKGHETYQLIGINRIPFSERDILLDALEELTASGIGV